MLPAGTPNCDAKVGFSLFLISRQEEKRGVSEFLKEFISSDDLITTVGIVLDSRSIETPTIESPTF